MNSEIICRIGWGQTRLVCCIEKNIGVNMNVTISFQECQLPIKLCGKPSTATIDSGGIPYPESCVVRAVYVLNANFMLYNVVLL